jgi:hypothetical protein
LPTYSKPAETQADQETGMYRDNTAITGRNHTGIPKVLFPVFYIKFFNQKIKEEEK